jgi:enoyl-CoA hydratase
MHNTYQNIIVEHESSTCIVTINRQPKLNALNNITLIELNNALIQALEDELIKGIIITGAGDKAFVAGADISEFQSLNRQEAKDLASFGHQVFNTVHSAYKPIIAAINGFALGGGLELALACHIRVAANNAKMGLPEVSLGLIPGYGGTQRLTQLVGRGNALEIILSGDMINAEKALSIGLVNHVVPLNELLIKSKELMDKIKTRSPKAVGAAIRAVNASPNLSGYETEINEFSNLFGSEEFQEGISAFLEKRAPNF